MQESFSLKATAISPRSEEVLELGKKLVAELGLDQSNDTLARWMAHYVAELIHKAENTRGEERLANQRTCYDVILGLWKHLHELPDGKRPFERMEPVLSALESLDPDNERPRYFRGVRPSTNETEQETEARKWLELVDGLDCAAKILIRYCLAQAASTALDKSKEWVMFAERAGLNDRIDLSIIVRFIAEEEELTKGGELNAAARKVVQDRIKHLDRFREVAAALEVDLRAELEQLDSEKAKS